MNYIKKAVTNTQTVATVALLAMAQTVLADGFSEVSSMAVTIRTGIYTIVGIVATLCLLWQMAQGFGGRKTWGGYFGNLFMDCRCRWCDCYRNLAVHKRRKLKLILRWEFLSNERRYSY